MKFKKPTPEIRMDDVIIPKVHIRYELIDGRCSCLVVWPDGEFKVEIFASREHVNKFVREHEKEGMILIDHTEKEK